MRAAWHSELRGRRCCIQAPVTAELSLLQTLLRVRVHKYLRLACRLVAEPRHPHRPSSSVRVPRLRLDVYTVCVDSLGVEGGEGLGN